MKEDTNELADKFLPGNVIIFEKKIGFKIIKIQEKAYQQIGYETKADFSENTGMMLANMLHSQDLENFIAYINHAEFDTKEFQGRFRRKNYTYAWIILQIEPCQWNDEWLLATGFEITQYIEEGIRQQKECKELEMVKNAFEVFSGDMPAGMYQNEFDEACSLTYINDGFFRLSGYTPQEIRDLFKNSYLQLICEDDREIFLNRMEELKEKEHKISIQYRLKCKSGKLRWVTSVIKSVRQENKKLLGYSLVVESDSENRTLLNIKKMADAVHYGIAIYEWNKGRSYCEYFNNALCENADIDKATMVEFLKQNPFGLIYEEDIPKIRAEVEKMVKEEDRFALPVRVVLKGEIKTIQMIGKIIERYASGIRFSVTIHRAENIREKWNPKTVSNKKASIKTFGYFDVEVNGQVIPFHSVKAKEFLAVLVDRRGGFVSRGEIISYLWEDECANKTTYARCRQNFKRLTDELKEYGIEDIVETASDGSRRIVPELVDCDLYQYLSGEEEYKNLFRGSYMSNYSWAEVTLSELIYD